MRTSALIASAVMMAFLWGCSNSPFMTGGDVSKLDVRKKKEKPPGKCKGSTDCGITFDVADAGCSVPNTNCVVLYEPATYVQNYRNKKLIISINKSFFTDITTDDPVKFKCVPLNASVRNVWECDNKSDQQANKFTVVIDSIGTIDPWVIND